MTQTISIAEAFEQQNKLYLFLSLAPVEPVDKIVKLVDAGNASIYRVFYRNEGMSTNKQGWDEIFAKSPGLFEKIWRKITS